jgi:hypothetical protein
MQDGGGPDFAHGLCHVLTSELMDLVPAGEAFGLFCGDESIHSAFRIAHTDTFVDAHGVSAGREGLEAKKASYARLGDQLTWRPIDAETVHRMSPKVRPGIRSAACTLARRLLQEADQVHLPINPSEGFSL